MTIFGHLRGELFPHIPSTVAWEEDRIIQDVCESEAVGENDKKGCKNGVKSWWPYLSRRLFSDFLAFTACNGTALQNIK